MAPIFDGTADIGAWQYERAFSKPVRVTALLLILVAELVVAWSLQ